MAAKKHEKAAGRSRAGRPRVESEAARSRRIVTFVTEGEFERLKEIADEEDRSLSYIARRIIENHLSQAQAEQDPRSG